jgi:tripartite ATP-independent transporter DctP family solute receptor
MKLSKVLFFVVIISLIFTGLVACKDDKNTDSSKSDSSGETVKLRLAEIHPDDYPTTLGDKEFARLVEEKTDGEVVIDVYANGVLGDETNIIKSVQMGSIDFARVSLAPMGEFQKDLNALQMPYLYRDDEHMWKVLDGDIGQNLLDGLSEENFYGLCFYDGGSRSFYNTKKEIKSLDDLKGLKIRVQENKLMQTLISSLGANPTSMAMSEVYSALKTGVIDGAENNFSSYVSANHYEVATYYTIDKHTRIPEIVIASKTSLDKLGEEKIEIIKESARESEALQIDEWNKAEEENRKKAEENGCKITELDEDTLKEFQEASQEVYDTEGKDFSELIEEIKAVE